MIKIFFPPTLPFQSFEKKILKKTKGLEEAIAMLSGKISITEMQQMNYKVEKKGETMYHVAKTFLETCSLK